jgi:restriction endonuclease S subunit
MLTPYLAISAPSLEFQQNFIHARICENEKVCANCTRKSAAPLALRRICKDKYRSDGQMALVQ